MLELLQVAVSQLRPILQSCNEGRRKASVGSRTAGSCCREGQKSLDEALHARLAYEAKGFQAPALQGTRRRAIEVEALKGGP